MYIYIYTYYIYITIYIYTYIQIIIYIYIYIHIHICINSTKRAPLKPEMCHTYPKAKFNSSAPRRNKRPTWNCSRKLEFIPWPRTQQLCGPFQPRSCTMKGWRSCWLGPIPMIPVTTSWWMVYFTMVSGRSVFNLTGKGFTHLHRFTFEIFWREPQFFEP